ncbi:MAG: glycosyltransferase family 2 protein [Chlamydiae bacterium]|nr:glycosyltransferase family 2 protein [Chlamydiota bacterium]MBI3277338.1 glycosyltransferase family 2 protein [Chlamydiota bacterium]
MKSLPLVSIIIPAYNEEKNIRSVIEDTLQLKTQFPLEIIVVDDGSKDETADVAKSAGADRVISYPKNKGKGGAFRMGVDEAKGEYIIQIDADHQFQPHEIPLLVEALHQGYDLVLGSRFNQGKVEKGSVKWVNVFGNWLMSATTTFFSGIKVTDIMAGFKGFKTEVARKLDLVTSHFGYEAEIIVKAGKMGFSVKEIPITYTKRIFGTSGVSAIRDGSKVAFTIAKMYFTFPGQVVGRGVVGKRVLKALTWAWLVIVLPLLTAWVQKGKVGNLTYAEHLLFSLAFFFVVRPLTGSRLAALVSSTFLAVTPIFDLGANATLPLIFSTPQSIKTFSSLMLSVTIWILLMGFMTFFLQDRKSKFLSGSILLGTVLHLACWVVSLWMPLTFAELLNLDFSLLGLLLAWYFWPLGKLFASSNLLASLIILAGTISGISWIHFLGASILVGTLISSLFIELVSFRIKKTSLFSFDRLFLFLLLGVFTMLIFSFKLAPYI